MKFKILRASLRPWGLVSSSSFISSHSPPSSTPSCQASLPLSHPLSPPLPGAAVPWPGIPAPTHYLFTCSIPSLCPGLSVAFPSSSKSTITPHPLCFSLPRHVTHLSMAPRETSVVCLPPSWGSPICTGLVALMSPAPLSQISTPSL